MRYKVPIFVMGVAIASSGVSEYFPDVFMYCLLFCCISFMCLVFISCFFLGGQLLILALVCGCAISYASLQAILLSVSAVIWHIANVLRKKLELFSKLYHVIWFAHIFRYGATFETNHLTHSPYTHRYISHNYIYIYIYMQDPTACFLPLISTKGN